MATTSKPAAGSVSVATITVGTPKAAAEQASTALGTGATTTSPSTCWPRKWSIAVATDGGSKSDRLARDTYHP